MTSRLLLTLLAFLTGLSAQGSTVQARAMPCTMHVAAVSALATVQSARAEAVLARPAPDLDLDRSETPSKCVAAPSSGRFPAVLTRIDRAHE